MQNNTLSDETAARLTELQFELDNLVLEFGTWDDDSLILPWEIQSLTTEIEAEMERLRADNLPSPG